jgi:hypothetical protein
MNQYYTHLHPISSQIHFNAHLHPIFRLMMPVQAWKFQGSIGRALMGAIEAGYCLLGQRASVDPKKRS